MNGKELQSIKANALALRKIADTVIRQVEALQSPSPLKRRRRTKEQGVADLTARLLSGKRKPTP